jgi:hypothetical protein
VDGDTSSTSRSRRQWSSTSLLSFFMALTNPLRSFLHPGLRGPSALRPMEVQQRAARTRSRKSPPESSLPAPSQRRPKANFAMQSPPSGEPSTPNNWGPSTSGRSGCLLAQARKWARICAGDA